MIKLGDSSVELFSRLKLKSIRTRLEKIHQEECKDLPFDDYLESDTFSYRVAAA